MLLFDRVQELLAKLPDEQDKRLVRDLLTVTEHARLHIEKGSGSYQMMRAVMKLYEPETLDLKEWTR